MTKTRISVATWNIGGGILGESHQENGASDLEYHSALLKEHSPDIVCLQEAHDFGDDNNQTQSIAARAGYPYYASFPISASHMNKRASLSLGLASRFPIEDCQYEQFPNPNLSATGPNGAKWILFDKGFATCTVRVSGSLLGILNAHCFPLHYFGANPTEARFAKMWEQLKSALLAKKAVMPTVAAIDLNFEPIDLLLGNDFMNHEYLNAFANTPTVPKGVQQDYLVYSTSLKLITTAVKPTRSDHSYCQVDIEL